MINGPAVHPLQILEMAELSRDFKRVYPLYLIHFSLDVESSPRVEMKGQVLMIVPVRPRPWQAAASLHIGFNQQGLVDVQPSLRKPMG